MHAVVVYESLWGNTAAIARAIARGIGPDAIVGSTAEISPVQAESADLLVAGAPVHAMNMPTAMSRSSAVRRNPRDGERPPDLGHPPLREWIGELAPLRGIAAAAFDTRVRGPLGHGGARRTASALVDAGASMLDGPCGFVVVNTRDTSGEARMLRDGEVDRAHAWGATLARLAAAATE